ncbi:hypothetical protein [Stenotrophomonas acidaminiphila]|uniref:hypothetical protein n=1 Tax=Stenotrophomonas acidaminiphila TaxID=128780 RepID=UPI0024AE15C6|nr:hypothetical protein [Stenotrophomonas acidaminiphila]WHL17674.1 hypothetical protein QLF99_11385 [Stenotrophomonas acidaminiphila]
MIAAEILVPCFSTAADCRFDWVAIAAMGGWAAAAATFFAVLLPFRQYRKALKDRQESDYVDGQIAGRGTVFALINIHAGIDAISANLASAQGIGDFTDSLRFVRDCIVPHPLPPQPREKALGALRVEMASLEGVLFKLAAYVKTHEMGFFDADSAKTYVVTIDFARLYINNVIKELEAAVPGSGIKALLPLFEVD